MNRAKIALYLTGAGWMSGILAFVIGLLAGTSAMATALFFGPALGFLLHGSAAAIAGIALIRPHPGSTSKRPAVTALLVALAGLLAAFGFATLWVAVASNGGA